MPRTRTEYNDNDDHDHDDDHVDDDYYDDDGDVLTQPTHFVWRTHL